MRKGYQSFILCIIIFILGVTQGQISQTNYSEYIQFHWKGGVRSTTIHLTIIPKYETLSASNRQTNIILFTKPSNSNSPINILSISQVTFSSSDALHVSKIQFTQLTPQTQYYYFFSFDGESVAALTSEDYITLYNEKAPQTFSFRTTAAELKAASFRFGAASCTTTGNNSTIYGVVNDLDLDFFLHLGDLFYTDVPTNNLSVAYNNYNAIFNSKTQKDLYEHTPIEYIWDDHDSGQNDGDGNNPGKPALTQAFRNLIPYHKIQNLLPSEDLAELEKSDLKFPYNLNYTQEQQFGLFRSFIIGRVLFIIPDLFSFKNVANTSDYLGDDQTIWLENQFKYAGNTEEIKLVLFISSGPWLANEHLLWGSYPAQKQVAAMIKNYVQDEDKEVIAISGDVHGIALDDGRNNKNGGFVITQQAPLAHPFTGCLGGPYSHGYSGLTGNYGYWTITDDGSDDDDAICVKIQLRSWEKDIIVYDTCNSENNTPVKNHVCEMYIDSEQNEWNLLTLFVVGIAIFACLIWLWKKWDDDQKKQKQQQEQRAQGVEPANDYGPDYIELLPSKGSRGSAGSGGS